MEWYYTKDGRYSATKDWIQILATLGTYLLIFFIILHIIGYVMRMIK